MDNDERNHPPHVLRALGRLPAEDEALVLKAMRDSSELIAPIDGPSDAQWAEHLNEQVQTLLRENERLRDALKLCLTCQIINPSGWEVAEDSLFEVRKIARRALAANVK